MNIIDQDQNKEKEHENSLSSTELNAGDDIEEDDSEVLIGELGVAKKNRKVWLLKIAKNLRASWGSQSPGTKLGEMILSKNTGVSDTSIALRIPPALLGSANKNNLNSEYAINLQPQTNSMYIFSENEEGQVVIEGKITHRGETGLPEITKEYLKHIRTRNSRIRKKRKLKVITDFSQVKHNKIGSVMNENVVAKITKEREALSNREKMLGIVAPNEKRQRMERNKLINVVFNAFEKTNVWDQKGLLKVTKQPLSFLKQILADLCIHHKSGPLRGMYELKPEYRHKTT